MFVNTRPHSMWISISKRSLKKKIPDKSNGQGETSIEVENNQAEHIP